MASDVRIWNGAAWQSIVGPQGPAGPTVVSADAGSIAKLGTDGRISVQPADLDSRFVNVAGDTMTGPLTITAPSNVFQLQGTGTTTQYIRSTDGGNAILDFLSGTVAGQLVQTGVNFNFVNYGAAGVTSFSQAGAGTIRFIVGGIQTLSATSTGVGITGNITATGTAHSFQPASILVNAISGLNADSLSDVTVTAPAAGQTLRYNGTNFVNAQLSYADLSGTIPALTQAQADARYVEVAGDWMSGPLRLGGTASFTATAPLDIDATTYRLRQPKTPASQTDTGEEGTVCWDTAYLYACVAPNQWRRIPWTDWSGAVTGGAWSPLTAATPPQYAVSFGGGTFVADAGKWSADGANWYAGTGLPVGNNFARAAYGNGTFVTVHRNLASANANFYTSSDGKTWTLRTFAVGGSSNSTGPRGVGFGGGRFVAMVNNAGTAANVLPRYSSDGITWASSAAPTGLAAGTLSVISGVAHSGGAAAGLFVAVGTLGVNATNRYITSPDGITWTARSLPLTLAWNDVAFGNGRFVAIAPGLAALTSVDGINWAQVNMPASADWEALTYGGGKWIAVAPNTSTAAQSSDGITWTTIPLPTGSAWNGIATNGTVFVATSGTTAPAILTPTPQLVTYFPIVASRTLVSSDANATVANVTTGANPVTITVPTNAALAFPIGTSITIMDASQTATTTIKADAGVTLNWSGKLVGSTATVLGGVGAEVQIPGPLSQVVLRKTAVDTWTILY